MLGASIDRSLSRPDVSLDWVVNVQQVQSKCSSRKPPSLLIVQVSGLADPVLEAVERIVSKQGAPPVVVLYNSRLMGIRDAAFASGASEVLPVDPPPGHFEEAVLPLAGIQPRRHQRVKARFNVRVHDSGRPWMGSAENISVGGIQLQGENKVKTPHAARLDLLWEEASPLALWGVPIDSRKTSMGFVSGFRFVGLSDAEHRSLEKYVANRSDGLLNDPYYMLAAPAQLKVADVIRLASGVDASGNKSLHEAAMLLTNCERLALTSMGGDSKDAGPLIQVAVARIKASQFSRELENFELRAPEDKKYITEVAIDVMASLEPAIEVFMRFSSERSSSASKELASDLKVIETGLERTVDRLGTALEPYNSDLASKVAKRLRELR